MQQKTRANPQIWRVAKWTYTAFSNRAFKTLAESKKNWYYDKAAELLKKINNNEFTGKDNHSD